MEVNKALQELNLRLNVLEYISQLNEQERSSLLEEAEEIRRENYGLIVSLPEETASKISQVRIFSIQVTGTELLPNEAWPAYRRSLEIEFKDGHRYTAQLNNERWHEGTK